MNHPRPSDLDVTAAPDQAEELNYPKLHRAGRNEWWRAVAGCLVVAALGLLLLPLVVMFVLGAVAAVSGYGTSAFVDDMKAFPGRLTPFSLAFGMLTVWCLLPATWAAQWLVHRLPIGSLASVRFRFRWRWFGLTLGLAVVAMLLSVLFTSFVPAVELESQSTTGLNALTATAWQFLLITVFLVPIQAAAEEYAFRGYLLQAWGGVFGGRVLSTWISVFASALVFALMHGSQEWPVFFDRFAFGVCAAVVVVLTGGLEAAIALHVVNNLFAFGIAVLFGDITTAMAPSGSSWWSIPVSLVQVGAFGVLVVWMARRKGLETTARLVPGSLVRRDRGPRFGGLQSSM